MQNTFLSALPSSAPVGRFRWTAFSDRFGFSNVQVLKHLPAHGEQGHVLHILIGDAYVVHLQDLDFSPVPVADEFHSDFDFHVLLSFLGGLAAALRLLYLLSAGSSGVLALKRNEAVFSAVDDVAQSNVLCGVFVRGFDLLCLAPAPVTTGFVVACFKGCMDCIKHFNFLSACRLRVWLSKLSAFIIAI